MAQGARLEPQHGGERKHARIGRGLSDAGEVRWNERRGRRTKPELGMPEAIDQEAAVAAAMAEPNIAKFVTPAPRKVVFVPGRLLNLVV